MPKYNGCVSLRYSAQIVLVLNFSEPNSQPVSLVFLSSSCSLSYTQMKQSKSQVGFRISHWVQVWHNSIFVKAFQLGFQITFWAFICWVQQCGTEFVAYTHTMNLFFELFVHWEILSNTTKAANIPSLLQPKIYITNINTSKVNPIIFWLNYFILFF